MAHPKLVNRGGRPIVKGTKQEKDCVVTPRFTRDEFELLKQAAEQDFLPLALWARQVLLKAATGGVG